MQQLTKRTNLWRILFAGAWLTCGLHSLGHLSADEPNPAFKVDVISPGNSASAVRKKALGDLPLDKISAELRPKADEILKSVSMFRRMPTLSFTTEPEVYNFFLAHPDVAISIWKVMDISNFEMWQTGPTNYEADSHDGSIGTVEVLHSTPEQHLVLCEGSFKSPVLPKAIKARALMHLQPTFQKGADGQTVVTHSLDLFVSFPSQPIDITAKILSPVSHAIADRNFRDVSLWCAMMNVAMAQQPQWIEHVAGKMDNVLEVRRSQLLKLALHMSVTARRRAIEQQTGQREVSLDQIAAALRQSGVSNSSNSAKEIIPARAEQSGKESSVETADGKK